MIFSWNDIDQIKFEKILKALGKTILESDEINDFFFEGANLKDNHSLLKKAKLLKKEDYLKDEYALKVQPKEIKKGNLFLHYKNYFPYEGFIYDEISVNTKNYQESTPLGYFDCDFPFLALEENDETWMSIIPHEINTMKEAIKEATGTVLTLGLGLGYFTFHALRKKEVKKVIVSEREKKIISLFKENLLPFFDNKEKLEIIEGDAFSFLNTCPKVDYIFADLWHQPEDGLPLYLLLNKFEERVPAKWVYWIENSMLALLRRSLIILVDEERHGSTDINYQKEANLGDKIINRLHFLLKEEKINSIGDLHRFLSISYLKGIAKKLVL